MNRKSTLLAVVALLYLAPLVAYVATFGLAVSADHQRWAEFGSALSGIYAPIAAALTIVVLLAQVELQRQINDHQYVQAHIQQARADIEFYAAQLASALNITLIPGQTLRHVLHASFSRPTSADLDGQVLRDLAANIHTNAPSALDLWFAVYPILEGLTAGRTTTFDMTLSSSKQKLLALLSYETCVALDNFHRVRTEGRTKVSYQFSRLAAAAGGA